MLIRANKMAELADEAEESHFRIIDAQAEKIVTDVLWQIADDPALQRARNFTILAPTVRDLENEVSNLLTSLGYNVNLHERPSVRVITFTW